MIKNNELLFWKWLTNFWGILTAVFFIINFFKILDVKESFGVLMIIYITVLSIFAGLKEYNRWKSKKFLSKYHGEIFIFGWTILMIIFILLNAGNPDKYTLSSEFTATYLSILGIFAISRKSKILKIK